MQRLGSCWAPKHLSCHCHVLEFWLWSAHIVPARRLAAVPSCDIASMQANFAASGRKR